MTKTISIIIGVVLGVLVLYYIALVVPGHFPESPGRDAPAQENDILNGTTTMEEMTLESTAFEQNGSIPSQYTCDGTNINPPLQFGNVPSEAVSLVLIVDDPDIPAVVKTSRGIEKFDHWVLFNLPPSLQGLEENFSGEGMLGANSAGNAAYTGPCPPPDYEPTEHRYVFQLYALDTELSLKEGATEADVRDAMKGHILGKAELIGVYDRAK